MADGFRRVFFSFRLMRLKTVEGSPQIVAMSAEAREDARRIGGAKFVGHGNGEGGKSLPRRPCNAPDVSEIEGIKVGRRGRPGQDGDGILGAGVSGKLGEGTSFRDTYGGAEPQAHFPFNAVIDFNSYLLAFCERVRISRHIQKCFVNGVWLYAVCALG